MKRLVLLTAAASLAACAPQDEVGVELLVPDDVEFAWSGALDGLHDGRVALIPLDLMVYGAQDGEPVEGAVVDLASGQVGFVDADLVAAADSACGDCPWDAYRDDLVDLDLAEVVDHLEPVTDATGLARVHAVVDVVQDEVLVVEVGLGADVRSVRLLPR